MKYLFAAIMLLSFASYSFADAKSCKKECREQADTCLDKAFAANEETMIDLHYMPYESNKSLDELYDNAGDLHKERKAVCKKELKECKAACEQE